MAAPSPVLFPLMCAVKTRENTRNPTASTDPAVAASATARSARSRWRCGTRSPLGPEVVVAVGDVVEDPFGDPSDAVRDDAPGAGIEGRLVEHVAHHGE